MTDHPSTFKGDHTTTTAASRGTIAPACTTPATAMACSTVPRACAAAAFAELVRHHDAAAEEHERAAYCIEKAGDREYHGDRAQARGVEVPPNALGRPLSIQETSHHRRFLRTPTRGDRPS